VQGPIVVRDQPLVPRRGRARAVAGTTPTRQPAEASSTGSPNHQEAPIPTTDNASKHFYTVREAAAVLRVDPATLYRAIREDAFPAAKLRSRYIVPAKALDQLIEQAASTGQVVDVAKLAAERRTERG
jgi:excisionase family DNA binding protein